jgi:hypothetical protein
LSRKVVLVAVLFGLSSIFLQSCGAAQKKERPQNIILIGWDGTQRNHVRECLSRGELGNLKKLSSEGTLVAIDILRATDTKAGWTQILTGYEPEVTGVFSNRKYQPIPKDTLSSNVWKNFSGRTSL